MDFRERSNQAAASTDSGFNGKNQFAKITSQSPGRLLQIGSVILLFSVTALVIGLSLFMAFGGHSQARSVNKKQYQAVFLNNGQVYFGHINSIDRSNVDLRNIYYLQTSGGTGTDAATTSASNVSLVKLGCELHAPVDQMLINADQVIFWENIQDSGQVVKAINDYKTQNASTGCSQASQSSTQQAPSTTTPTTANPTMTATPTKKP